MKTAIYPGTFDPLTKGHLDVLTRARKLFDRVIVAIANNSSKSPIFSAEKRLELIMPNIESMDGVEACVFEGITVDLARKHSATALIRGLRAVSDFEYEFQMAQMNRHLADDLETLFLMPSQDHFYTSSKLIKTVAQFQPDRVADFVPENVLEALKQHFTNK